MAEKVPSRPKHRAMPARTAPRAKEHPDAGPGESPQQSAAGKLFPIVGVGASAGGLEAFTAFLKHLPDDSGMAFVLIQHLDPKQHSRLTDLLSKATRMPVLEVDADTPVEPNHVYVTEPGVCLSMSDGHIRVEERGGRNLPIDHFLRSLAGDNTSKAIGIVLSGTASDGTLGLKAVKAEGGITFAQEPSSAKFDGMPRSAIAGGVVDFVLAPAEIAKRLVLLALHPFVEVKAGEDSDITARREAEEARREEEERYRTLFNLGPVAVYSCDASGVIRDFNARAAELWGRFPEPGDTDERLCGSYKMLLPDGTFLPHAECPMGRGAVRQNPGGAGHGSPD